MATNDLVRLELSIGTRTLRCSEVGLTWPPPERLIINMEDLNGPLLREPTDDDPPQHILRRVSMSALSDEEAERMDHVARGAVYRYEKEAEK